MSHIETESDGCQGGFAWGGFLVVLEVLYHVVHNGFAQQSAVIPALYGAAEQVFAPFKQPETVGYYGKKVHHHGEIRYDIGWALNFEWWYSASSQHVTYRVLFFNVATGEVFGDLIPAHLIKTIMQTEYRVLGHTRL